MWWAFESEDVMNVSSLMKLAAFIGEAAHSQPLDKRGKQQDQIDIDQLDAGDATASCAATPLVCLIPTRIPTRKEKWTDATQKVPSLGCTSTAASIEEPSL